MIASLLLALAPPQAAVAPQMHCALETPAGDAIEFVASAAAEGRLALAPAADTPWPAAKLLARPAASELRKAAGVERAFAIGGAQGLILQLGNPGTGAQSAMLMQRSDRSVQHALAAGFCRALDTAPDPSGAREAEAGDIAAPVFDPARWLEDACPMITLDGKRHSIGYRLKSSARAELLALESGLWNEASILVQREERTGGMAGFGTATGTAPAGIETFFATDPGKKTGRGTRVLLFTRLGAPAEGGAVAICGYANMTARATRG